MSRFFIGCFYDVNNFESNNNNVCFLLILKYVSIMFNFHLCFDRVFERMFLFVIFHRFMVFLFCLVFHVLILFSRISSIVIIAKISLFLSSRWFFSSYFCCEIQENDQHGPPKGLVFCWLEWRLKERWCRQKKTNITRVTKLWFGDGWTFQDWCIIGLQTYFWFL